MNIKHFLPLLGIALLTACSDEEHTGIGQANENANPALFPEAGHLEIPRIDNETGDIYVHYATTEQGGRLLNYALDWHADKKHSRWVAFVFTNTTATTHWNRNKWNGAYWDGQYWEGDPFQPDPDIPAGERTELADFRGSGYDRGHLCASADRLCSMDANGQTFYLSNMSPQQSNFNQDDWVKLEGQIQNWGRNSSFRDTLFVVKGGTIRDDQIKTHTRSGIAVPRYYFAALLCKKYAGGQNTYKAIGFWVEHKSYGGSPDLRSWAVSIDELETLTGIDFFCNLPDAVENAVERNCDPGLWNGL